MSNLLEDSPNVASSTSNVGEDNEDEERDGDEEKLTSSRSISQTDDTYQREIDILLKLFPQKDKVRVLACRNIILTYLLTEFHL